MGKALVAALCVYAALCGALYVTAARGTGSHFVYPLDDAYIHMALARNVAEHGVFGITPYEYSSSSSTPLWVMIMAAGFRLSGTSEAVPAVMCFSSGVLLLCLCGYLLKRAEVPALIRGAALMGIVFATPMPYLALSGMEPLLHAALVIAIVYCAATVLADGPGPSSNRALLLTCLFIALAVPVRFESLFLAALIAGCLFLRRGLLPAFCVVGAAALPMAITGGIAVRHGWFWLPASVLLKTTPPFRQNFTIVEYLGARSLDQLYGSPHLVVLAAALTAAFFLRQWSRPTFSLQRADWMIIISVLAMLLHLEFAGVGWQFRYEAYLVALGLFVLAFSLAGTTFSFSRFTLSAPLSPRAWFVMFVLIVVSYPLVKRSVRAIGDFPAASHNIYEQQFQMAQFLRRYYYDAPVAANDVGAINFYTQIHCVDTAGLGTLAVARDLLRGIYMTQAIEAYTSRENVRIAVLYERWFNGLYLPVPPLSWIKVGRWTVPDDQILGGDTVTFYAAQPAECALLRANLAAYAPLLPKGVMVTQFECK